MLFTWITKAYAWLAQTLKNLMPASLFARALLILVLPVLMMQGVILYVFYEEHWSNVQRHLSYATARDIALLVDEMQRGSEAQKKDIAATAGSMLHIEVMQEPEDKDIKHFPSKSSHPDLEVFARQLHHAINKPFDVTILQTEEEPQAVVRVQLPHAVLKIEFSMKRIANVTSELFGWWMMGSTVVLLLIATVFLRNQIRPIRKLAEAAELFGRGQDMVDFRPQGAHEVRLAGRSFLAMRERLHRMISARTEMLAAISHDLRTPLTRMRLEIALLPPSPPLNSLVEDVQDMERMVQEYLDFASGAGREQPQRVRISILLDAVIQKYAAQQQAIDIHITYDPEMTLLYDALRRCIQNLLDNALRYGSHCRIATRKSETGLEITIEDNGPGIPENLREFALQPFKRLDPSRNQDDGGGAGLGLSIVQDSVLRQGGELALEDSDLGGLKVRITLPE